MSKNAIVIVLGLVVAAMPFLGFPSLWETAILVVLGVSVALLAFLLRQDMLHAPTRWHMPATHDVHVENGVGGEIKVANKYSVNDAEKRA
ncbi:MAG TPA: hypothetical protein VGA06_01710 [Candidatus Paceibacterota bacterium]|jgi:hypothetical protein